MIHFSIQFAKTLEDKDRGAKVHNIELENTPISKKNLTLKVFLSKRVRKYFLASFSRSKKVTISKLELDRTNLRPENSEPDDLGSLYCLNTETIKPTQ